MANYKIYKNIRLVGTKGDDGDAAESDITAPIGAIFALDSDTVPTGYQETTPPEPPAPPEPNYLYKWDLTKSLTDEIQGKNIYLQNSATQDSGGIHCNAAYAWFYMDNNSSNPKFRRGRTVVFEMGEMSMINTGNHGRFIMWLPAQGFIYRKTGSWQIYDGAWKTNELENEITDISYFSNSALKIEWLLDGKMKFYKNNVLVYQYTSTRESFSDFMVNSGEGWSYFPLTCKAVKIYENE